MIIGKLRKPYTYSEQGEKCGKEDEASEKNNHARAFEMKASVG